MTNDEAYEIQKFYSELIDNYGMISDDGDEWNIKYKFDKNSKYSRYEILRGDNCATIIVEGLEPIKGKMTLMMKISFSPAMLLRALETIYVNDMINPFYKNDLFYRQKGY